MDWGEAANKIATGYNLAVPAVVLLAGALRWWSWRTETGQRRMLLLAANPGRVFWGMLGALFFLVAMWRGHWAVALLASGPAEYAPWAKVSKGALLLPIVCGLSCLLWAWHPMIARAFGPWWWVAVSAVGVAVFACGVLVAV